MIPDNVAFTIYRQRDTGTGRLSHYVAVNEDAPERRGHTGRTLQEAIEGVFPSPRRKAIDSSTP